MSSAKVAKVRADQLLVERGLVPSREKARALLLAGDVYSGERRIDKPGQLLAADTPLTLRQQPPYVSRSGGKLAAALEHFAIDPAGRVCLDVGASTGGFTDCLLQRGAARVYAVDVGRNQLDTRIAADPRVIRCEGVNARWLGSDEVPERVGLAVADVSFISLTMVLPVLPPLLARGADAVVLIKPQFEVGRGKVGKGGIVRDHELQLAACENVLAAARLAGFEVRGTIASPIKGAEGNQEYLAALVAPLG